MLHEHVNAKKNFDVKFGFGSLFRIMMALTFTLEFLLLV